MCVIRPNENSDVTGGDDVVTRYVCFLPNIPFRIMANKFNLGFVQETMVTYINWDFPFRELKLRRRMVWE